jgi:hypothetical protein
MALNSSTIGAAKLKLDAERRACEIRLRAEHKAGQLLSKAVSDQIGLKRVGSARSLDG